MTSTCPTLSSSFSQTNSEYDRVFDVPCSCPMFAIENPSFETSGVGWQSFVDGFIYTTAHASDGVQSIEVTNGGAYQVITLPAG